MTLPSGAEDTLARRVLGGSLRVQPRETVAIETWSHALPWALALVREARRRRAVPVLVLEEEETFFRSLVLPQVRVVPRAPRVLLGGLDAYVYLPGPEAFPRLFALADRELDVAVARHDGSWWDEARHRRVRVARLAISAATRTAAGHYGIDWEDWQRRMFRASLVPPSQLHRRGRRLAHSLARARRIRIRHSNGTDLSVDLRPGVAIVEDGRVDPEDMRSGRPGTSIPSGVVSVRLARGSAEGVWESNRQTYLRFQDPPTTVGARLVFRDGRLTEYAFDRGGEAFSAGYARAGPGRDMPTRISFGLNPAAQGAPELEEIAAGAVTLWLGGSPRGLGRTPVPFSFASPLGGADVELDGHPWWADGRLLRPRRPRRPRTTPERTVAARRNGGRGAPRALSGAERSARR